MLILCNCKLRYILDFMIRKKGDFKKILLLGIPLFAGNFSRYLLQLADTVMVGRLGTAELASIAIAGLYCHVLLTFIWPLTSGVQALASRRFGRQNLSLAESGADPEEVTGSDLRSVIHECAVEADNICCIPESDGERMHAAERGRVDNIGVLKKRDNSLSPEAFTGKVLTSGFAAGICAGLGAFVFSFASSFILNLLIDEKQLLPPALDYTNLLRWAFPIAGLGVVISGFLAGINMTFQIMVVTIGSNILNIFFNYIFIFGSFGFPRMGVEGAALGTVLAEIIGTLYLIIYLLHEKKLIAYRIFNFRGMELRLVKDIARISFPIAVQNIIALTVFLVYESFIGIIGTAYLASTHIIFSVFRVNKTIVGGFARAGGILTGNFLGADDRDRALQVVKDCAFIGLVIGLAVVAAVLTVPQYIASAFTRDHETAMITVRALRFFALFFFVEVFGYTFEIIFSGIGWSKFVLFSEFTTNMIFILFMTWLCIKVLDLGIYWGWLSFALYQVFHALILTAGWLSRKWLSVEVESRG